MSEIILDPKQLEAIALCENLVERLVAVTGSAGTGKTTIIKQVYDALSKRGIQVVLAAPTGKAARRIKEATGINASTVHKLLEYGRPGERDEETGKAVDPTFPKRDRQNPLSAKVVIVDEYAMISQELHDNIIAALPSGGCLRAFGDANQLPPIEEYMVVTKDHVTPFTKLLTRVGKSVILDHVYRQGTDSNILENADRIRKGYTPKLNVDLGDFYIKLTDKPIPLLKNYIRDALTNGIDYRKIENQVITPSNKSWVGAYQLNEILRNLLNPNPIQTLELPRHGWDKNALRVGLADKVVCTENSYDLRDYFQRYEEWDDDMKPVSSSYIPCPDTKQMLNGETGIVTQIYPDGALDIDFGDRTVEIPTIINEYWLKRDTVIEVQPLRSLGLAYALTTHKCQGSEFEQIIYLLNKSTIFAQSRQNLYTAVTRAKTRATIITDQTSLAVSLRKVAK